MLENFGSRIRETMRRVFIIARENDHELEFLFVAYSTSFKYIAYNIKQVAKKNSFVSFVLLGFEDTMHYI